MDLNHLYCLPLHVNPCRLDPCINQNFFVLPLSKSILGVWKVSELRQLVREKSKPQPIELEGHTSNINALTFTNGSTNQLASSCREKLLLWDLDPQKSEFKSRLFFSNPGDLTVIGFNNINNIIAAGKGPKILIIKSGQNKITSVLDMHKATVTGVTFCPHYTATLVSISDDRTCCVWDTEDSILLHQSSVLSSAPLLSMTMNLLSPSVAVGSGDGKLIVFDLTNGHHFRQLSNLDIASIINKENQKMIESNKTNSNLKLEDGGTFAEASESILSLEYAYFGQNSHSLEAIFGQTISGVSEILTDIPPTLNIVTTNRIIQINSRSLETQNIISLQASMKSEGFISSLIIGSISYAVTKQINPAQMFFVAGTVFDQKIHVFEWYFMTDSLKSLLQNHEDSDSIEPLNLECNEKLNIVATNPLEAGSPLKSEILPSVIKSAPTKGDVATGKKKPNSKMSQPLTFKSTVKSSGYSQAPRTTMFKPETSRQKLLNLSGSLKKTPTMKSKAGKMLKSDYDSTSWHVKDFIDTFEVDNQSSAVFDLRFTDDGTALACALSNKSAIVIKSPFSKHICTPLIGHDNSINSVFWSNCGTYILTGSNDKTVRLWDRSSGDPLMVMTHKKCTPKEMLQNPNESYTTSTLKSQKTITTFSSSHSSTDNKTFSKEISRAQFYYMDKFILVTHGCDLSLYKYQVTPDIDDLKRYQSRNRYKLIENWTSMSTFTCSSAVNNFFSHLVLCTTSGKSIEVYDVNKSLLAHTFTDCHSRPPQSVVINEGSCFSSQSSSAYNVIATIAPTDPVKLWDLRSKSCVQALVGHHNKSHSCRISFSPCGNYLSSGSEDRAIYLFDLRTGTFCEKLKGPKDVVCSVAFNPAKSLLVAGCLDGNILWYK